MATKTISLELDAYEKLRAARLREKESFSSVVRRAVFPPATHSGEEILRRLGDFAEVPDARVLEYWDVMRREDDRNPRISAARWEGGRAS